MLDSSQIAFLQKHLGSPSGRRIMASSLSNTLRSIAQTAYHPPEQTLQENAESFLRQFYGDVTETIDKGKEDWMVVLQPQIAHILRDVHSHVVFPDTFTFIGFDTVWPNLQPDPQCPECKGTGWYVGLFVKDRCKTCRKR